MTRTRRRAALALTLTAALASAACSAGSSSGAGGGGGSSSSGSADTTLTLGLVAEPASLDFTRTDGAAIPQALLNNVYDGLVKLDNSGRVVPDLATSWTVSPDRKTYTFELVPDATFSSGAPFTAEDAVFSIDRVKTDWTVSLKKAMDVVQEAKALSPTQLQVTLARPSNDWLYRMGTRIGAMFSRTGVDALATTPIGTGPYTLQAWNRGDSIVLARNDKHVGDKPFFSTVTLKYFKDPTALNNALLSGTIDVIGTVQAPESLAQFSGNDKYDVIEGTTNGEVVLSMNNSRPPMDDPLVRQAVRSAIDHKALVDTCWAGRGQLIGSMVPPTDPWYEDLTGVFPYDRAKAEALLAQAGKTGVSVRLRLPTLPYATSCGQVVKSQLEQAGFTVQLDQLEFPAAWLSTVFKAADYDLSIVSHVEPHDLGTVFTPTYYTRYSDPEFAKDVAAADAGSEQDQTTELKAAARRLSENAAADWLFLLPNIIVAEKGITGLPRNSVTESFDLSNVARS